MSKMNNKIEVLRALWFMEDESPEINGFDFTEDEIKLVEEFKKIYELGTPQLEKVIKLLDNSENTYNILYFKSVLRNGPFKEQVEKLIENSKKLIDVGDNMGNVGIPIFTMQNIVIFEDTETEEISKTVSSKLPKFMVDARKDAIEVVENLFRNGMKSSASIDNTFIEDKKNQQRYGAEPSGNWTSEPNGNLIVKDRYFYYQIESIEDGIKKKVKSYLESKNSGQSYPTRFDMLMDIKEYNLFDKDMNESKAAIPKENKNKITEKIDGEEMMLDLMGDTIITKKQLKKTIEINSETSNKSINPNTNKGQLDN